MNDLVGAWLRCWCCCRLPGLQASLDTLVARATWTPEAAYQQRQKDDERDENGEKERQIDFLLDGDCVAKGIFVTAAIKFMAVATPYVGLFDTGEVISWAFSTVLRTAASRGNR